MKRKAVKILALLLTLVMLVTAVPVYAFAQNSDTTQTNVSNNMQVTGTNSFGRLLADGFDTSVVDTSAVYYISDVSFNAQTATVTYGCEDNSKLVVAVYDENTGKMLASEITDVEAESESASVTFAQTLPQYFTVKAFLLDENNAARCKEFVSDHYTKNFTDFYQKSTDDFDSSDVINFDKDKTNNFLVLEDDVDRISSSSSKNTVVTADDDNLLYVIKNADSSVTSLKPGDIAVFDSGNNEDLVIVKVKKITSSGTTVSIESDALTLDDVFEYIKIEVTADDDDFEITEDDVCPGFIAQQAPAKAPQKGKTSPDEVKLSKVFAFDSTTLDKEKDPKKHVSLDCHIRGSLTVSLTVDANYYHDKELDISEASLTAALSVSVSLTFSLSISVQLPICDFCTTIIPGVYFGLTPEFVINGSCTATISGMLTTSASAKYNSATGFSKEYHKPNFKPTIKIEAEIDIGVDLKPYIKIIGKKLCYLELKSSALFKIKATGNALNQPASGMVHICNECIDGEIKFTFTLSASVTFGKDTMFESKLDSGNLLPFFDIHLCWFYYSITFDEFAFTKCPHLYYKTTFQIVHKGDNKPIKDAVINGLSGAYTISDDKVTEVTSLRTDENGKATVYYNLGKKSIYVSAIGYKDRAFDFKVEKGGATVSVALDFEELYPVTISVSDYITGLPLSKVNIKIHNGYATETPSDKTTVTTDYDGVRTVYFPYNSLDKSVKCTREDYTTVTQIIDKDVKNNNHYDVKMYKCETQKVTVTVTDADTGEAIRSAYLTYSGTEDNPYKPLGITEVLGLTGADGRDIAELPRGGYTLSITATGYESVSDTLTVGTSDLTRSYTMKKGSDENQPSDGTGSNDSVFTGTEATGTIINFGSYPQSKVTDSATLAQLDAAAKNWKSYNYYSGTGSWYDGQMTASTYMKYCDIKLGGSKYRAVTFSEYRPYNTGYKSTEDYTYQDDNGYYTNNVYYFKYEPLRWRVLDAGEGLVLSENIVDSQAYNNYVLSSGSYYRGNPDKTYYASDWANSSLRHWLNNDFYNTAFSSAQQSRIKKTQLENKSTYSSNYDSADTNDNIFLLSYWDVMNTNYGFSSSYSANDVNRRAHSTDYAKCQGCYTYKNSTNQTASGAFSGWRLRSPSYSGDACSVHSGGYAYSIGYVDDTLVGVRPALRLAKSSNPISPAPRKNASAKAGAASSVKTMYTSCGACTAGADYILLNVTGYGEEFTLTSENLLYIDQLTADGSGSLNIQFTPKYNDPGSTTLLIGDFGSGIEAKTLTVSEVKKYSVTWIINGKQTTESLAQGDPITPPAVPEKPGYTFKGWTPELPRSMPGNDLTLTAVYEKNPDPQGKVKSVKIDDVKLNYKKFTTLKPVIDADKGVTYTVKYESSNPKVATVDENGKVTATKRGSGSATITCTVTDQYGNVVTDTCTVNVSLSFGQKIIVYLLFGWIWY